jgi:transcriptional regulator GlxA family with amidase domain
LEANQTIPVRETERMMKLQDVILKAMAKKVSWMEAAEIAGMSVRNMQRRRQRYVEHSYTGLFDQWRGKRSIHQIAIAYSRTLMAADTAGFRTTAGMTCG